MSSCAVRSGMLFWKKACGEGAVGSCKQCGADVCGRHAAAYGDGSFICIGCGAEVDDSDGTGTVFSLGGISQTVSDKISAAGEGISAATESWHGGDSGNTGGSSDSGGGDPGGSSSD